MSNEPTPWEDINPPMVSARTPEPRSKSLDLRAPASTECFAAELTACLALVSPVGMEEAARREWLQVAWATLKHLPPDILAIGCKKARETCDHPSKVVPTILKETEQMVRWRFESRPAPSNAPRLSKPKYVTAEEAASILKQYGLKRKPEDPATN